MLPGWGDLGLKCLGIPGLSTSIHRHDALTTCASYVQTRAHPYTHACTRSHADPHSRHRLLDAEAWTFLRGRVGPALVGQTAFVPRVDRCHLSGLVRQALCSPCIRLVSSDHSQRGISTAVTPGLWSGHAQGRGRAGPTCGLGPPGPQPPPRSLQTGEKPGSAGRRTTASKLRRQEAAWTHLVSIRGELGGSTPI